MFNAQSLNCSKLNLLKAQMLNAQCSIFNSDGDGCQLAVCPLGCHDAQLVTPCRIYVSESRIPYRVRSTPYIIHVNSKYQIIPVGSLRSTSAAYHPFQGAAYVRYQSVPTPATGAKHILWRTKVGRTELTNPRV